MTDNRYFRTVKARKAAFGFTCSIKDPNAVVAAGKGIERILQLDPSALVEVDCNYSKSDVKVYTNCESTAQIFTAEFSINAQ